MLDLLKQIKEVLTDDTVCTDNIVFRLHTRATVIFLAVCSTILTVKTYFANPINCFTNDETKLPLEAINTFCWVTSTAIVAENVSGIKGTHNAGLGMRQSVNQTDLIEQGYYKWVCLFLAFQAILFYAPRALWIVWERKIISFLAKDLATPLPEEVWTQEKRTHLANYFSNSMGNSNNFYAIRFSFCEVLNLINSMCQIYFLDLLLDGQFSLLGPASVTYATAYDTSAMIDPLKQLFPLTAKCSIHYFGPSGTVQEKDAFCILTLNMINEKIFIFMWFWLIILCILGVITLIYRLLMFTLPSVRIYLLQAQTRFVSRSKIKNVVLNLPFGDWFLLYQLANNVNPVVFKELVLQIEEEFSPKKYLASP